MSELIYRGINYKSHKQKHHRKIYHQTPCDRCGASGARKMQNFDRVISIKPMHYYTYRGVSYTKTVISDSHQKILLDINE